MVKVLQFISKRPQGSLFTENESVNYHETFHQELNEQCGSIILLAALIATFVWLPYISIDRDLYPEEPLIIAIRIGMSFTGLAVLVLRCFERFRRYNLFFLIIIIAYLEIATALITGLTKADSFYIGRYLFILTLLALLPIHRLQAWSILVVSILVFFVAGFFKDMPFESVRLRYGLNNLAVTASIVALAIYLLDRLRFESWQKSLKIRQQNEDLKADKAKIDELLHGIRLSEAKYRQLFDHSPIGIFLTTAEGKVLTANKAIFELLKFDSVDEINAMGLPNLYVDLKDRAALWEKLKSGPVSGYETAFRRADGELISVSIGGYILYDEGENASLMEGTIEDITERKLMEAALRDSENKYRFLIENSIDIVWTLDLKTMAFSFVSNSVEPILGYSSEESVGTTIDIIFSPETIKSLITAFGNIIGRAATNDRVFFEAEHIAKDGRKIWMEINAVVQKDKTGKPAFLNGISRDITKRKRTEAEREEAVEALRLSEEQYRQIVNNASDCISRVNSIGLFTFVNPAFEKLLGYSISDIEGHGYWEFVEPSYQKTAIDFFQDMALRQIKETYFEFPGITKSGETVWISQVSRRQELAGGEIDYLCISRDITERKRSEQAIRESERRLADVIDFLPLATMVIDREGRVSAWNRAMEVITGVNRADILGKGDYEYSIPFYGERRPILIDLVFASEEDLATKYSHIRRERGILTAEAFIPKLGIILVGYASELHDSEGKIVGAIESVHNITDIRRVEAELKEAKKAADAANRSKSAFLANMSHEIRTPMNAILGFAQLMERDPLLSAESRDHLEIINRSGEHLLELINEILEMSKIEAGRATFVPNTFDLHALLHDVERMFRIRTEARGFRFLVEKIGHVPRWVVTDEGKLRQVLINLLGNAVKFTEEGGIALRLRAKDGKADTIDLQFEVEDTGPGMSEEEIGRLFQAFEQTSAGIRSGGTGLGLSLSRGFVQIMGGSISVASTIGKGTAFRFEIPIKQGREDETPLEESKGRVLHLNPGQREIRVLIADDRETNRQLLLRLLAAAGFSTREVVNGEEVVRMVREWKPQVVLMDMTMPVMDGYEATRIIKSSTDLADTVVIAVTASAFEEDRKRIIAAGADGFLPKPFKERELFEIVARLTGAEYLYEEEGVPEQAPRAAEDYEEMHKIVENLPDSIISRMHNAVEGADLDLLNELAGQLTDKYPSFVRGIEELAARYDYEALIKLFSGERNK